MALLNIKIFGKTIGDSFLIKFIIGFIAFIFLIIVMGTDAFGQWIQNSLFIYLISLMFILTLTYIFINEEITLKHIAMIITSIILFIVYAVITSKSPGEIFVAIAQSIIWATAFSVLFEFIKKRLE